MSIILTHTVPFSFRYEHRTRCGTLQEFPCGWWFKTFSLFNPVTWLLIKQYYVVYLYIYIHMISSQFFVELQIMSIYPRKKNVLRCGVQFLHPAFQTYFILSRSWCIKFMIMFPSFSSSIVPVFRFLVSRSWVSLKSPGPLAQVFRWLNGG